MLRRHPTPSAADARQCCATMATHDSRIEVPTAAEQGRRHRSEMTAVMGQPWGKRNSFIKRTLRFGFFPRPEPRRRPRSALRLLGLLLLEVAPVLTPLLQKNSLLALKVGLAEAAEQGQRQCVRRSGGRPVCGGSITPADALLLGFEALVHLVLDLGAVPHDGDGKIT